MQADAGDLGQRPAHPRRRETKCGRLWQAKDLIGGHKLRQLLAHAIVKWIAAREDRHRPAAPPENFGESLMKRARPLEALARDGAVGEGEMPGPAHHQLRLADEAAGDGRKPIESILADADDGQPASRRDFCS
jgi:hypothetical protein